MRNSLLPILALSFLLCSCATKSTSDETARYLQPVRSETDLILVEGAKGDQVVDIMQRFLIPKLYKEVGSESASHCSYQYLGKGQTPLQADLGTCKKLVKPTCFQLLETIRKSILSKQEVEMTTRICVGKSLVQDAILLEVVYGEAKKWSGSNLSVNAQKEFSELKALLAQNLGEQKIQFVRKLTPSQAQRLSP